MAVDTSKVTIHMVSSLDGFIAKKDGDVSWLHSQDKYEKGISLSEEYIQAFLDGIDCYVMGSRTYEHALELGWPYGEKPIIVVTHRELKTDRTNVTFYNGDLSILINEQLKPQYPHIWMAGGSEVTKSFIQSDLVDEIVVSLMPIILGDGTLFFDYVGQEKALHLKDVVAYQDGMVELTYEVKRET